MQKIRILLANRPRMTRELLKEMIENQPDMEVVGEMLDPVDLLLAVRETGSDAVILDLQESEERGLTSQLLDEYPELTIVGLATNGRIAFVRPRRREIADPTGAKLVSALRHAVQERGNRDEDIAPDWTRGMRQ